MRKAMAKAPDDRYQKAGDMLVDVEQVMRVAFRAVGQTELARWLSDLSAKDGVPPLTREQVPGPSDTIVMDRPPLMTAVKVSAPPPIPGRPRPPAPPRAASGTESGVELDLDGADAALVAAPPRDSSTPPPPPPRRPGSARASRRARHVVAPASVLEGADVPQARGARGRRRGAAGDRDRGAAGRALARAGDARVVGAGANPDAGGRAAQRRPRPRPRPMCRRHLLLSR